MLLLVGCPDATKPLPPLDQEGEPCRASYKICLAEERVRECIDETWVDRACDESCLDQGPAMISLGCEEVSVDNPIEGCACAPVPGACAPGDTMCESETQIIYCDESQIWTGYECDELCAMTLATPNSMGCSEDEDGRSVCWCVAEEG